MQPDDKAHRIIHSSSWPEQHPNARCIIRQIIEMQHYPPKRSTVADIRIWRYNIRHNRQKGASSRQPRLTANETRVFAWAC